MALPSYSTGTATVAAGGTNVALTGGTTAFNNVVAGDEFYIPGQAIPPSKVVDIVDNENFTITPWGGSAASGAAYKVLQDSKLRFTDVEIAIDLKKQVQALNTEGFYRFVASQFADPDAAGLTADDGQYAFQASTGKLWIMQSAVWTFLGVFKGFGLPAAYDSSKTYNLFDTATQDGSTYVWINATLGSGHAPPNATYWNVLAGKGDPGAPGANGTNGAPGTDGAPGPSPWTAPAAWVTGTAYVAAPPASAVTQGGETYVCLTPHTSGTFATDLAAGKWIKVAAKGADGTGVGDVVGPASATDAHIVLFDTTSGKAIKDSGKAVSDFATAAQGAKADSAVQDIAAVTHAATSKTTPVDADEFALVDSAASNILKKLTWANLRAFFATASQGAKADSALQGAFGFRNRIINPNGQVWQRANNGAAAITDVTYCFDRWYGLTQSAGITASQVSNAANGIPFMMRLTQANATAQRFGIVQAIESANCIDMRGQSVTLSAQVRMSAATTLRYAIVEWSGTADTITKDVVNDWTNGTFTTGNFFISTTTTITATGSVTLAANTLTPINLAGTVSGSMNNIIVFFWTDSTQAQNVTLDIGKVQFELGSSTSPLAVRSVQQELSLCMRYYWRNLPGVSFAPFGVGVNVDAATAGTYVQFLTIMRAPPSVSTTSTSNLQILTTGAASVSAVSIGATSNIGATVLSTTTGLSGGGAHILRSSNASGDLIFNSDI